MSRLLALALVAAVSACPAYAYDHYSTYRIHGNEILSVRADTPPPEDPWRLTLVVGPNTAEAETLVVESDASLAYCADIAAEAKGEDGKIVTIVVWDNAQTMNGTLVSRCGIEVDFSPPETD